MRHDDEHVVTDSWRRFICVASQLGGRHHRSPRRVNNAVDARGSGGRPLGALYGAQDHSVAGRYERFNSPRTIPDTLNNGSAQAILAEAHR